MSTIIRTLRPIESYGCSFPSPGTLASVPDAAAAALVAAGLAEALESEVSDSLYIANSILKADTAGSPAPLTVPEGTVVGRVSGGDVAALTAAQVKHMLPTASGLGFAPRSTTKAYTFLGFVGASTIVAADNGSAGGTYLARSTDDGVTWTRCQQLDATYAPNAFWESAAGTWFVFAGSKLYRDAGGDKGNGFTEVLTVGGMLHQGWSQESGGRIWVAQYEGDAKVWYSDDDGATWTLAWDPANTQGDESAPFDMQHIHGVQALTSGVWVMAGDSNSYAGLWKWTGSTFVRQTPQDTGATAQRWRTVGLIERSGWLYWIVDGAVDAPPAIYKANPADLAGTIVKVADVPTGGWYSALTPGGVILLGGVVEQIGESYSTEQDVACRMWAVDAADHVHEVFSTLRTSGVGGTFTRVSNLKVRAADGRVGFTVGPVDWAAGMVGTVIGDVVAGGQRYVIDRRTAPGAYGLPSQRYWESPQATTSYENTTSTTAAQIRDMAVTVTSDKRPLRIVAVIPLYSNVANAYNNVHIRANGVQISPKDATQFYGVGIGTVTLDVVHTPSVHGSVTYSVWWAAQSGVNFQTNGEGRRIRVYEI